MKKTGLFVGLAIGIGLLFLPVSAKAAGIPMSRLYNPNSGEHFYTANTNERDHLKRVGWRYEGIGWNAPSKGTPVYRLYNKNAGDHHYTLNTHERDNLKRAGWRDEGSLGTHRAAVLRCIVSTTRMQRPVPITTRFTPMNEMI